MKAHRSAALQWISFSVMIGIAVLLMKLLNWIPAILQQDDLRKYASLEEARSALRTITLAVPAYFPEEIGWPPSAVYAQRKPFALAILHFPGVGSPQIALSVYQMEAGSGYVPPVRGRELHLRQEMQVRVRRAPAVLRLAVCADNEVCNSLEWEARGFRYMLVTSSEPRDLIRMAESIP